MAGKIIVSEFIEDFDESEVYYDESFQRRVVWSNETLSKFIRSITKGWASLTTIVEADVDKCLKHCRKVGDAASINYFKDTRKKGYRYISLDGQNRSKKVVSFINNEIAITGDFIDADGEIIAVKNKFFKDLPVRLRDRIMGSYLNVEIAPPSVKDDLSEQFQALNSGDPLNEQETRNSFLTPIAEWVRQTSKNFGEALARVVKEDDLYRMKDDELIAKMTMVLIKNNPKNNGNWGLSHKEIDAFYRAGLTYASLEDEGGPYGLKALERAENILDLWSYCMLQQKHYPRSKLVSAKMFWATLYACEWVYDNSYDISDYKPFFEELKRIDDKLITNSQSEFAQRRIDHLKNGLDPDDISSNSYYFTWVRLPHQAPNRLSRIAMLVDQLQKKKSDLFLRKHSRKKAA